MAAKGGNILIFLQLVVDLFFRIDDDEDHLVNLFPPGQFQGRPHVTHGANRFFDGSQAEVVGHAPVDQVKVGFLL